MSAIVFYSLVGVTIFTLGMSGGTALSLYLFSRPSPTDKAREKVRQARIALNNAEKELWQLAEKTKVDAQAATRS